MNWLNLNFAVIWSSVCIYYSYLRVCMCWCARLSYVPCTQRCRIDPTWSSRLLTRLFLHCSNMQVRHVSVLIKQNILLCTLIVILAMIAVMVSNIKSRVNWIYQFANMSYTTETHVPYGITQSYLQPGSGDIPAFTTANLAGTRFSDSGGMQGWVDLVGLYTHRKMVTHTSTNQAQHKVTLFVLPLCLATNCNRITGCILIVVVVC